MGKLVLQLQIVLLSQISHCKSCLISQWVAASVVAAEAASDADARIHLMGDEMEFHGNDLRVWDMANYQANAHLKSSAVSLKAMHLH